MEFDRNKFPLVEVDWIDIKSDSAWIDFDSLDKKIEETMNEKCYSVGFLLKDEKDYIIISYSISLKDNGEIDDVSYEFIPKGVIKSIRVV